MSRAVEIATLRQQAATDETRLTCPTCNKPTHISGPMFTVAALDTFSRVDSELKVAQDVSLDQLVQRVYGAPTSGLGEQLDQIDVQPHRRHLLLIASLPRVLGWFLRRPFGRLRQVVVAHRSEDLLNRRADLTRHAGDGTPGGVA